MVHKGRLTRFVKSNKLNALGIICQGVSTGANTSVSNSRACFWDNNGDLWPNTPYPINSAAFNAPPNLPNNNQCTDCHAGENAFITHPGSPIDTAKANFDFTLRNNWYKPRVQVGWPSNPEQGAYPKGVDNGNGCGSCHNAGYAGRLPNVTGAVAADRLFKFCNFVLPNELTQTISAAHDPGQMRSYALSPPNNAANAAKVTSLFNACKALFPPNPAATPSADPTVSIPSTFPATQSSWLQPVLPPN